MPFGIVLGGCTPDIQKANFYVPSVFPSQAPISQPQVKASHVYLQTSCSCLKDLIYEVEHLDISPEVTAIVKLPQWTSVVQLYRALRHITYKTAILAPIVEDLSYFSTLRDLFSGVADSPGLILEFDEDVPEPRLNHYKCLPYMGVYISSTGSPSVYDAAAKLLRKWSLPVLLISEDVSTIQPYTFWSSLSAPKLAPLSDVFIDPLQPLTVDMELDVYETFEKDQTKYAQYERAIEMAISDLGLAHNSLKILVIGPGRGPLLNMVMKYARPQDHVTAIEKNKKCYSILTELCQGLPETVKLILGDVRHLGRSILASFDLVISELLGSFGCNEAAPEILDVFRDFLPVMIPQEFKSFVQPIYTDLCTEKCQDRPYLAKLNSFYAVSEPVSVFEYTYPDKNEMNQQKCVTFSADAHHICNAFYGYFEAVLYGPYKIGIKPGQSCLEFCSSWYPILFPISRTKLPLSVTFTRKSSDHVSYEWVVDDRKYGRDYRVSLE